MKKISLWCLFLTVPFIFMAAVSDEKTVASNPIITPTVIPADSVSNFYPITNGNTLYLSGYFKKEPTKKIKIKATVAGGEKIEGKDYGYFYAPQADIRYMMRTDEKGVYMRRIKYPFPIFNFSINVDIIPEMQIMKYPAVKGETWKYEGKGEAVILFIPLSKKIVSEFECFGIEKVKAPAGEFDAIHIKVMVNEGDNSVAKKNEYWYAKDIGYAVADTDGHFAELEGCKVFADGDTTTVKVDIPPAGGEKTYE